MRDFIQLSICVILIIVGLVWACNLKSYRDDPHYKMGMENIDEYLETFEEPVKITIKFK